MKKLLLFGLAVSIGLSVNSQSRIAPGVKVTPVKKSFVRTARAEIARDRSASSPLREVTPPSTEMRSTSIVSEAVIGTTWYDTQTNRGTAKRISNNMDGTLSAVWTMSPAGPIGTWPDRGTGYNYFDGTAWGAAPTARIEPVRVGFTNIDWNQQLGEYVCAHTGASGLLLSSRLTKGTGAWDTTTVGTFNLFAGQADVWSRMALGGANGTSVHVIVNSQGTGTSPVIGMNGPLTYSRSQDGGNTWDRDHIVLPGDSALDYWGVGAEEYHIDSRGDVIAIVEGGFTHDVVLYKSMDNGTTWTKTIIKAFPIPLYDDATMNTDLDLDGFGDTISTNAGDVTVTLDNNNMAHVAFGDMRVIEDPGATGVSYFPTDDGLMYWNENMGAAAPVLIAASQDFNGNGFIDIPIPSTTGSPYGLYNVGFTGQPSIGVDANNSIYIAYSAIDERADTNAFQQALRHVFAIKSMDGGNTWSNPVTVVPDAEPGGNGAYQEAVYPSVATFVGSDCMHIVYQRDAAPGNTLSTDAAVVDNNDDAPSNIVYACVPPTDFVMGIAEHNNSNSDWVSDNYPNPVKDFTSVIVNLTKTSDVTLEVTNLVGQVMFTEKRKALTSGSHSIRIDASHLDAGAYFYNVTTGNQKVSRKMIVE